MNDRKRPEDATLADVLIDGFEKNEVNRGFHRRELPMPDAASATRKFRALAEEATRWKGEPLHTEANPNRELAAWQGLEIRRAGRGVMVRVAAPSFDQWWHEAETWAGDPMGAIIEWIEEDEAG